jgi:glycolate oxidase FAD binding subunit
MTVRPESVAEAVEAVRDLSRSGGTLHPVGSGSRSGWGGGDPAASTPVQTAGLDRIVAHNEGDFTAVLQAGVPLAQAQAAFAHSGQWLAIDPPPHAEKGSGTIGGLVATADSGPSRHGYGGVRDVVIGTTVVLADGSLARSGGTVIKNVAGYDLGKLLTGSYGTLGLIVEVAVRLHPVPPTTATVVVHDPDAAQLVPAALDLIRTAGAPTCLDLGCDDDGGRLLVRYSGHAALERAKDLATTLTNARVEDDDAPLWMQQRSAQRGALVVKVSGRSSDLSTVAQVARRHGAHAVSRLALGLSWLALPADADLAAVRADLAPRSATVLDGGDRVEQPWPAVAPAALALMRRVKERFDPTGVFRPGCFVGGI